MAVDVTMITIIGVAAVVGAAWLESSKGGNPISMVKKKRKNTVLLNQIWE